jgi:pyruvate formate lyase activating enzyme
MNNYLDTTGRIFDIQRFSVHDGPGIRTIVFLKGCALRCKWCCNPESQSSKIEQMVMNNETKTVGKDVSVREVLETVEKDRPYFRRSGGGLTLSGGESLCQPDFATALLRGAKEKAINTAMETTGFADYEKVIKRIIPYLDLFLMDIKHINPQKHKEFTSQSNELILENAKKIAREGKELIIRVPVIPTFNDTVEEIEQIAKFAESLRSVRHLHLLPYHRFGLDKYKGLGREYSLNDITTPSNEHMEMLKKAAEKYSIEVQIGG